MTAATTPYSGTTTSQLLPVVVSGTEGAAATATAFLRKNSACWDASTSLAQVHHTLLTQLSSLLTVGLTHSRLSPCRSSQPSLQGLSVWFGCHVKHRHTLGCGECDKHKKTQYKITKQLTETLKYLFLSFLISLK